jgi:ABC-type uncharacterized transport system substrate-binding protein
VSFLVTTLAAKRLELLRELVPSATVVGFLVNTANPTSEAQTRDAQAAALALGLRLVLQSASSEADIDAAFANFAQQRVQAVMVAADQFFGTRHDQLVGLAARHAMPATYYLSEAVAAGGLMSYGTSRTDAFRLAAAYAGRILKGEKPGDLPVQQTVKFELGINHKTATRAHFFLWLRAGDVPLRRARAKNLGPLQAVPVMARAMAERLV